MRGGALHSLGKGCQSLSATGRRRREFSGGACPFERLGPPGKVVKHDAEGDLGLGVDGIAARGEGIVHLGDQHCAAQGDQLDLNGDQRYFSLLSGL